jgi:hypothetical protein
VIAAVAFALTTMMLGYRKIGLPPVVIVGGSSVIAPCIPRPPHDPRHLGHRANGPAPAGGSVSVADVAPVTAWHDVPSLVVLSATRGVVPVTAIRVAPP